MEVMKLMPHAVIKDKPSLSPILLSHYLKGTKYVWETKKSFIELNIFIKKYILENQKTRTEKHK